MEHIMEQHIIGFQQVQEDIMEHIGLQEEGGVEGVVDGNKRAKMPF